MKEKREENRRVKRKISQNKMVAEPMDRFSENESGNPGKGSVKTGYIGENEKLKVACA